MLRRLRARARAVRLETAALWLAARDRRTPWHARLLAVAVALLAVSLVDLVPDVIPVLGLLDDAVLLPALIVVTVRMIPDALMAEHRLEALRRAARPWSPSGRAAVAAAWLAVALLVAWLVLP